MCPVMLTGFLVSVQPRFGLLASPAHRSTPHRCDVAGQGVGFYTGDDGYLYCDNMKVEDCRLEHLAALMAAGIPQQPMYLYSKAKLTANYNSYKEAFGDLPHIIGYAVKANNNLPIMKHLQTLGSGAVLVSGNELKLAMAAGFDTTKYDLHELFPRIPGCRVALLVKAGRWDVLAEQC